VRLQLVLRGYQLLLQPPHCGFQLVALLADFSSFLLGALPPFGFRFQRLRQPLNLLCYLCMCRAQFVGSRFKPALFGT